MKVDTASVNGWQSRRKTEIHRGGTIISLILSVFLTVFWIELLRQRPELIGWYRGGRPIAQLFDSGVLALFIPWWYFALVLNIIAHLLKLIYAAWTPPVILAVLAEQLTSSTIGILFLLQENLITPQFTAQFAEFAGMTVIRMQENLKTARIVLIVIMALGMLFSIIQAGAKMYKTL